MRCSFPAFSGNRQDLENHVLKSLAEEENFHSFITYIKQPRKHVENFIKEQVNKYILEDNKDKARQIVSRNVDELKDSKIKPCMMQQRKSKQRVATLKCCSSNFPMFSKISWYSQCLVRTSAISVILTSSKKK